METKQRGLSSALYVAGPCSWPIACSEQHTRAMIALWAHIPALSRAVLSTLFTSSSKRSNVLFPG